MRRQTVAFGWQIFWGESADLIPYLLAHKSGVPREVAECRPVSVGVIEDFQPRDVGKRAKVLKIWELLGKGRASADVERYIARRVGLHSNDIRIAAGKCGTGASHFRGRQAR